MSTTEKSAGARQAKSPEERQASLDATLAQLQAGVEALRSSDGWQAWLEFAARLPTYSANNQLLILTQRPDARAVAGYTAWKAVGRQVRRGEFGIKILAPTTRRVSDHDGAEHESTAPEPDDVREQSRRVLTGFRVASVFDVSQTDGDPLPEPERPTLLEGQAPDGLWAALARQVSAAGFHLDRSPNAASIGGANGVTDFRQRSVLVRQDVSDAQAVKTLAHELGHVLLHDPTVDESWSMPCREVKEVEAESVAFLVSAYAGLDTSDYTFAYVAGWARSQPSDALTKTAARVLSTAKAITYAIDPSMHSELAVGLERGQAVPAVTSVRRSTPALISADSLTM